MKKITTSRLTLAAVIAALYAGLTLALTPIAFGPLQFRAAEALTLLPLYFPESIPGLFVGCVIANAVGVALGAAGPWDILIGSLATLAAAIITSRVKNRFLAALPPVILNALLVGPMLAMLFTERAAWSAAIPYQMLTVGLGEAAVVYLLGVPLSYVIERSLPALQKRLR